MKHVKISLSFSPSLEAHFGGFFQVVVQQHVPLVRLLQSGHEISELFFQNFVLFRLEFVGGLFVNLNDGRNIPQNFFDSGPFDPQLRNRINFRNFPFGVFGKNISCL
jgi:hypothetical protein